MLVCFIDGVSQVSNALFIFLYSFFPSSDWVVSIDLYLSVPILSSAAKIFWWIPLVIFFFHVWVIVLFNSSSSIKKMCIFFLYSPFGETSVILNFNSLCMVSFNPLNVFIIAYLKSLSVKFNIWASSRIRSNWPVFSPLYGPYFLSLFML